MAEAHTAASIRHPLGSRQEARSISLALQGGGSFGAFTWGVLDRLLEEEHLLFDAVSGASAGAVNAVLLASGLAESGRMGARKRLQRFWHRASEAAPRIQPGIAAAIATRILSPYQFNPFNLNPLRTLLANEINFDVLRNNPSLRLLIGATRVRDGKMHVFQEKDLTIDVILASACLPVIHHAVSIDGETYWDGGYSANPPLIPLVARSRASEILIVQIMPTAGADMPTTASEIAKRMEQITFNSSLLRDMDALAAMTKLAEAEVQGSRLLQRLQKLRLHHVSAETEYPLLSQASALNLDRHFLFQLRDAGRVAADRWLSSSSELQFLDPFRNEGPESSDGQRPSAQAQLVTSPFSVRVKRLWQLSQAKLAKLLSRS
ncbi:patatin-like phospholipase family protein (plasmid) [Microvirga sp. VF16]|nr:patatin-like phospholipase family protein [Microvirga sp. VF16]